MYFEVLLEGGSDQPAVKEILERYFGLREGQDFRLHPHQGRGRLPANPLAHPDSRQRGLLDQLPAKLRGYSWCTADYCVVVLVDADNDHCEELKSELLALYASLPKKPPRVLFRIAVEETESWFIADAAAVRLAYPKARTQALEAIAPDAVCGAWEQLAKALREDPHNVRGPDKFRWAQAIAPHLDLTAPRSPSLRQFIRGIDRCLAADSGDA